MTFSSSSLSSFSSLCSSSSLSFLSIFYPSFSDYFFYLLFLLFVLLFFVPFLFHFILFFPFSFFYIPSSSSFFLLCHKPPINILQSFLSHTSTAASYILLINRHHQQYRQPSPLDRRLEFAILIFPRHYLCHHYNHHYHSHRPTSAIISVITTIIIISTPYSPAQSILQDGKKILNVAIVLN